MEDISIDTLRQAVQGAAAIRRVSRLQPAGGQGDKVFPPTYEGGMYAEERRVIDGVRVPCVLLDSVQSQANRYEEALLEAHRAGRIAVPVISVNFGQHIPEVGTITSLDAPHRIADAILRDSLVDDVPFRASSVGKVLDDAAVTNASDLFEVCPTALVFGVWDSTGPRGGLGTKFARVLVGEIVAVDAETGVRPSSRVDPLGIVLGAGDVYMGADGEWTLDANMAKASKFKKVKPSEINHGNVTPSLKTDKGISHHGGVTFAWARQSAVLSLAGLRRLRFPDGSGTISEKRDEAARVALAALGLASVALATERGLALRSRCDLVVEEGTKSCWTIVGPEGEVRDVALSAQQACGLLATAVDAAKAVGLGWRSEGIEAQPKPELVELVRRSRNAAMAAPAEA